MTFAADTKHTHQRTVVAMVEGSDGSEKGVIPLVSGSLTEDLSSASGTRSGRLRLPLQADLVPDSETHFLHPFTGNRIRFSATIGANTVIMGRWIIGDVTVQRPGGIDVTLVDLAYLVKQDLLESEQTRKGTKRVKDNILDYVDECIGYRPTYAIDESGGATFNDIGEMVFTAGTSQWDACLQMAEELGCDLWFGVDLRLNLAKTDRVRSPVDVLGVGSQGVITNLSSGISRIGVVNRAVVILEGEDDSVGRGVRSITSGVLRYSGPIGNAVVVETRRIESKATNATAASMAQRLLTRMSGTWRELELQTVPIPHVRAGDSISVKFSDGSEERALVHRITHGLASGDATTVSTRYEPKTLGIPWNADPIALHRGIP